MNPILKYLRNENVFWKYERGDKHHPVLTNGLHSDIYLNFYNLNKPSSFKKFLEITGLMEKLKVNINAVDCVCGIPNGGNFFAFIIGSLFDKPVVFSERKEGQYILKGYNGAYKTMLLVDDVITTGKTLYAFLHDYNFITYPYIFCLALRMPFVNFNYNDSIYNIIYGINISKYSKFYEENNCPMCLEGSIAMKVKDHWTLFMRTK